MSSLVSECLERVPRQHVLRRSQGMFLHSHASSIGRQQESEVAGVTLVAWRDDKGEWGHGMSPATWAYGAPVA